MPIRTKLNNYIIDNMKDVTKEDIVRVFYTVTRTIDRVLDLVLNADIYQSLTKRALKN